MQTKKQFLIQQSKHTLFVGELNKVDLEEVPILVVQTYVVYGGAKQGRLRSGSYLSRASIHGLWES